MVTHTAVEQAMDHHQAMDHRQDMDHRLAMDKVDLHMARIQDLTVRPPRQETPMAVDQVLGKVKDTVEATEDLMSIEMEDIVIWRRKPKMTIQKTKWKPLKVHEA